MEPDARPQTGPGPVFVIIPAYNEAGGIDSVLRGLLPRHPNVVVVDDGSADGTAEAAERRGAWVVRHAVNLGQGAALQTGGELALALGASVLVHFDADGQHRPEEVDVLLDPIRRNEADIVFGSRFLGNGTGVPFLKRRLLLPAARLVNWIFTGLYLTDAHNGCRALSRQAAELITLRQNRMAHATEILELTRRHRLRFAEVPVTIDYREFGQGFAGGIRIVRDLLLKSLFPR